MNTLNQVILFVIYSKCTSKPFFPIKNEKIQIVLISNQVPIGYELRGQFYANLIYFVIRDLIKISETIQLFLK